MSLPVQRVGYPRVFMKNKDKSVISAQDDQALDVRSLLRRKDRGVFHMKEANDPAQVISESAFYKLNLRQNEARIPDETTRLLTKSNRSAIKQNMKAKRSLMKRHKEQVSRPSK